MTNRPHFAHIQGIREGPAELGEDIIPTNFGLPRKQKIAVNRFWVQESEIGEECRQF